MDTFEEGIESELEEPSSLIAEAGSDMCGMNIADFETINPTQAHRHTTESWATQPQPPHSNVAAPDP